MSKCETVAAEIAAVGGEGLPLVCEVEHRDQIEASCRRVVDEWGRIDVLVNNAQAMTYLSIGKLTDDDMESMWRSGPLACFRLMQACFPYLRDSKGSVINMGSGSSILPHAKLGGSALHHVTPASAEDHVGPTARGLVGERGPKSGGRARDDGPGPIPVEERATHGFSYFGAQSLEDDAFRNDVARPCAVDPRTARCRFAVAGTPTGYAAAPSGTFAADGHGAPSARSRSPMSATSTASRPRRLAVARARADASLGPADVRGLGSNVMLRPG